MICQQHENKNALDWFLFQIDLLGIFNLSKNLDVLLKIPYHQCYYCGKPNFYIKNLKTKKFNLKEIFVIKIYAKKVQILKGMTTAVMQNEQEKEKL